MDFTKLEKALEKMDAKFWAFINCSFDPWEASKWDNEVWEARERMCHAWDEVRAALGEDE